MYQQSQTWLPSAQQMGLGEISFADLARAARRSRRGVGQTTVCASQVPTPIAPGSPCYDSSHDAGMSHCGPALTSWLTPGVTANCSAAEESCICNGPATAVSVIAPAILAPGLPTGYDATTGTITGNPTGTTVPTTSPIAAAFSLFCPAGSTTDANGKCINPATGTATSDWCSQNLGIPCLWVGIIALVAVVGMAIAKGGR